MTVQSVKQGADPTVLHVGLSDGSSFFLRLTYLEPVVPVPSAALELSEEILFAYRLASDAYAAETAALRLISLREHSRFLLSMKLRKREFTDHSIRLSLDRLEAEGLIDDERFAAAWLESRCASKSEGRSKLLSGLLSRGVSREVAAKVLNRVVSEDAELASARRLIDKYPRDIAMRKLRLLGFSAKIIRGAFYPDDR